VKSGQGLLAMTPTWAADFPCFVVETRLNVAHFQKKRKTLYFVFPMGIFILDIFGGV
jgi:hypothetical protein